MALKSNWADGDTYTAAAANAVATTVNSLALGVGPVALQQDTTLLASSEIQTNSPLEIPSSFFLEIPATSTLEIYSYVPPSGAQTAFVATAETTSSSTPVNLTTSTDNVTVNIGPSGSALVAISTRIEGQATGGYSTMTFAVSGANTISGSTNVTLGRAIGFNNTSNVYAQIGGSFLLTGLTPGPTNFQAQYSAPAVGGVFTYRRIAVAPL